MTEVRFVPFRSLEDPVRARLLAELLRDEGIPVSTAGLEHRSLLGIAGGFVRIVLEVPEDRLDDAEAVVRAYEEAPVGDDEEQEAGGGEAEEAPSRGSRRTVRGMLLYAFLFPLGGGHLYAGAEGEALILALTSLTSVWLGRTLGLLLVVPFVVVLVDVVGAADRIVELRREGAPPGSRGPAGAFVVAPAFALALYLIAAHAPSLLARPFAGPGCDVLVACAAEATETEGAELWPRDMAECLGDIGAEIAHRPARLPDIRLWIDCVRAGSCVDAARCELYAPGGSGLEAIPAALPMPRAAGWPWRR